MRARWALVLILAASCSSETGGDSSPSSSGSASSTSSGQGGGFSSNCPTATVFPEMTCVGSLEGGVCGGSTYCDACQQDVALSCRCEATSIGYQFKCNDCAPACPSGSGGAGGNSASGGGGSTGCGFCDAADAVPNCPPLTGCAALCATGPTEKCYAELQAYLSCGEQATDWTCVGQGPYAASCYTQADTWMKCVAN